MIVPKDMKGANCIFVFFKLFELKDLIIPKIDPVITVIKNAIMPAINPSINPDIPNRKISPSPIPPLLLNIYTKPIKEDKNIPPNI